jgi:hypothetical protein
MSVKKVFVNAKGMVFLLCPFCGDNSEQPAKQFPSNQIMSIACSCGKTYEFQVEVRKHFRKATALGGFYLKDDAPDHFLKMMVTDLSLDGCCLRVSDKHTLHVGDSILIVFKLDNAKRTEINRHATVLRVVGNIIGCQLTRDVYDPELGFYVEDFKVCE